MKQNTQTSKQNHDKSQRQDQSKSQRNNHSKSLRHIAWQQFRKHPMARAALIILAILYLMAAFADFFAPYPEVYLDKTALYQPPHKVRIVAEGRLVRPYICHMDSAIDMETFQRLWQEDCQRRYPIKFFVHRYGIRDRDKYTPFPVNLIPVQLRNRGWTITLAGKEYTIMPRIRDWATLHLFGLADAEGKPLTEQHIHLWGTDSTGFDIYGKILFGARISLTIGILGATVSMLLGLLMGGLAGYFGGWLDELIMRVVEAISAIPAIFLLLALSAIFYPLGWPSSYIFTAIIVALSLIGWGSIARSIRGLVLSLREEEFTIAAKALGAGNWRIIQQHLLPQTFSYVIVQMSLAIPSYILLESVLSFYGLGIQAPATSWGLMLATAQKTTNFTGLIERWWIFLPGLFIFIAVLTWNLLGDGLRDAFDPRSRQ